MRDGWGGGGDCIRKWFDHRQMVVTVGVLASLGSLRLPGVSHEEVLVIWQFDTVLSFGSLTRLSVEWQGASGDTLWGESVFFDFRLPALIRDGRELERGWTHFMLFNSGLGVGMGVRGGVGVGDIGGSSVSVTTILGMCPCWGTGVVWQGLPKGEGWSGEPFLLEVTLLSENTLALRRSGEGVCWGERPSSLRHLFSPCLGLRLGCLAWSVCVCGKRVSLSLLHLRASSLYGVTVSVLSNSFSSSCTLGTRTGRYVCLRLPIPLGFLGGRVKRREIGQG